MEIRRVRTRRSLADRFWPKVIKTDGCWLWASAKNDYGSIKLPTGSRAVQRKLRAHRASWMLHFGNIPDGMDICHKCDNPPCVNPDHLFLGTRADNMADMVNKGRAKTPDNRGTKHGMSKLTDAIVLEILAMLKSGSRGCDVAMKFDVSSATVSCIKHGTRWAHLRNVTS